MARAIRHPDTPQVLINLPRELYEQLFERAVNVELISLAAFCRRAIRDALAGSSSQAA